MKLSLELTVDTRPEWVDAVMADFRETPLQSATSWGHKEVAELLIDNGADVNSKIDAGQYTGTPLDWAESVSRRDSPEVKASKKGIADFLRKHGAKEGN